MPITEKYVTPTGAGTNDGLSEANAFSWAQFITDFNAQTTGGVRYNIKQGTYSGLATATLTGDGTTTSPLIIRGYKTTIGDATLNKLTGNFVDDSNMPHLQFASTAFLDGNGATGTIIESVRMSSSNVNRVARLGANSVFFNCKINHTSGNGAAVEGNEICAVLHCELSNASTTGSSVCNCVGPIIGNRISAPTTAGSGITMSGANFPCEGNLIIGCGAGINKNVTSARNVIANNTIVGCAGDGISIVNASTTFFAVIGNHITGCGGWGINLNTPTCPFLLSNNRLRNNTSGAINGGGDWASGMAWLHINTAGSDSADFTNAGSGDYSLLSTAPGYGKSYGHLRNIGAIGTPAGSGGSSKPFFPFNQSVIG